MHLSVFRQVSTAIEGNKSQDNGISRSGQTQLGQQQKKCTWYYLGKKVTQNLMLTLRAGDMLLVWRSGRELVSNMHRDVSTLTSL